MSHGRLVRTRSTLVFLSVVITKTGRIVLTIELEEPSVKELRRADNPHLTRH